MRAFDRVLLSPWIQRASAAWFIAGALIFGLHLAEEGLRRVDALNAIGVMLMATGLIGLLASWLRNRLKSPVSAPGQVDGSRLWATIFGEEQKEREKRARQIAKDNIDREAKR